MEDTKSFSRRIKEPAATGAKLWLLLAIAWLSFSSAAYAQLYKPNYLANSTFDAITLAEGEILQYGAQGRTVDGWTYTGESGIGRDSSVDFGYTSNFAFAVCGAVPGSIRQTMNLPARGTYKFGIPLSTFNGWNSLYYTLKITDPLGRVLIS